MRTLVLGQFCTGLITNSLHPEGWNNEPTVVSFKGDAELAVSSPRCGARGMKQRKVSSVCDSDKTKTEPPQETKPSGSEQQPGITDEDVHDDTGHKYVLFLNMGLFQKLSCHIPLSFYIYSMCFSRKGTKSVQSW